MRLGTTEAHAGQAAYIRWVGESLNWQCRGDGLFASNIPNGGFMQIRHALISLGVASALAAAPAFAQTAVVVDSTLPPGTAVVITEPSNAYVANPDLPGTHLATDQFGRTIVVDDNYASSNAGSYTTTPPPRRNMFDSSVDHATGTVTSPGYMGPRDTSGQ
jgi:hypothetical protein